MQFNSGSVAGGAAFIFALNGSPLLWWIAIVTIVLTMIFLVHVIFKRRKEEREAHEGRVLRNAHF